MKINMHCNLANGDMLDKVIKVAVVPRKGESIWLEDKDAVGEFDVTHVSHEGGKVEIITQQQ